MADRLNLSHRWLAEKLEAPESWSVRDRDDIVFFIEKKRAELVKTPRHHQPLFDTRAKYLAQLEEAMQGYIDTH